MTEWTRAQIEEAVSWAKHKSSTWKPYEKQRIFFALGASKRERLLIAGNQVGKSEAGAFEAYLHLTGNYPTWWEGKRFDKPTRGWAAGLTGQLVRDVQQTKLCGKPGVEGALGTGFIPKNAFVDRPSMARGATDAYDTIQVRHASGGISTLTFKSFEQGRQRFQGEPIDFAWGDEEGPSDVYSEMLTRVSATGGIVYVTYTPIAGKTDLTNRFLSEPSEDRAYVSMTIFDAAHISPEQREKIIAGTPAYERDARIMGIPMLGSGRVFPFGDDAVTEPAIKEPPAHWFKAWGTDFGVSQNTDQHAFAAVLACIDRDPIDDQGRARDVIHITHAIKLFGQPVFQHAAAMRAIAADAPVLWPHDGHRTGPGDGKETVATAALYRREGLRMNASHTTFAEGGYSLEAGVLEMTTLIEQGRLKFAAHLSQLMEEFRFYHRKEGVIVSRNDDLLSAVRQIVMGRRFAKQCALGGARYRAPSSQVQIADGLDFDIFG